MPRRIVNADEQDAYTKWRHILCYTHKAGVIKAIKRRTHRRERREARRHVSQFNPEDF